MKDNVQESYHFALIQRGGTGIKDVKHCWRNGSTEMTYRVSVVYLCPRLTINDIEPGGRLSMFFFHILFPSSSSHTSLSILKYTHLSELTLYQHTLEATILFLHSALLMDGIGSIREHFPVD